MIADQHFLKNESVLERIASFAKKEDIVLEIGAGHGELTKHLVKNAKLVYANEIDRDLFKMKAQNCRAIPGNILSINFPNANKIFGNIPYSVSEPLLERLFKEHFDEAYFLVSNSFFEIISGIKNSRFGIVCPLFFNVKRLFDVKRELFEPVPRVDSVFLRLKKRKDLKKWGAVTKEFYLQKDKHIKNALNTALFRICAWTKKEVKEKLAKYNLTNKRVYMLNSKEFLELVKVVKDLVGNSD